MSYRPFHRIVNLALCCALLAGLLAPARAGLLGTPASTFASGAGNILFLAAGTALPLVTDGSQGKEHALRTADALAVSVLLSTGLKSVIHVQRPDGSDDKSFPSGHATAAFAVATAVSAYHPRQAPYWYLGAAVIADSRLELHKHRFGDVLVGALLGHLTTRWELSRPHGLLIAPVLTPHGATGVQLTAAF